MIVQPIPPTYATVRRQPSLSPTIPDNRFAMMLLRNM